MGTLVVVAGDPVEGTDTHKIEGAGTESSSGSPAPYKGTARFDYKGKMTDQLSDFASIEGSALATVASKSTLNPGESAPGGAHAGPSGSSLVPETATVTPTTSTLVITDPIGDGFPGAGTGSSFVSVDGSAVLLDGDSIDTCDGFGAPGNSTVTSANQDFVSCSE